VANTQDISTTYRVGDSGLILILFSERVLKENYTNHLKIINHED